ncbi:MAG: hypothetical protein AAF591_07015 [Verrucomicrobiota bacterium]
MKIKSIQIILTTFSGTCLLVACSTSLEVSKTTDDGSSPVGQDWIPFYLPMQELRVTEKGVNARGAFTPNKVLEFELVTKVDPDRRFYIRHKPGIFTDNKFSITRDSGGRIMGVTAEVEDKKKETIEALASLAVKGALAASATADPAVAARENEISNLEKAKENLKKKLGTGGGTAEEVNKLLTAIASIEDRIQKLKALNVPASGTKPSRISTPLVNIAKHHGDVLKQGMNLKGGEIGIYIVPKD